GVVRAYNPHEPEAKRRKTHDHSPFTKDSDKKTRPKGNPTTRHQRRRPCRSIIYTHPTTNTKPQVEAENPGIVMVNDARVCSTASALTPGKAQRCSPRS